MRHVRILREHIDARRYRWFDLFRVVVGALLFARGVGYAGLFEDRLFELRGTELFAWGMLAHVVVGAHLVGGVFLMAGLLTRLSAAISGVVVLGALLYAQQTGAGAGDVVLGALLALACGVVFFAGPGPWSFDARLEHHWRNKRAHVHDLDPLPARRTDDVVPLPG